MPATTPGLQTVDKLPVVVRANFTVEGTVEFPAGGLADQKPLINLVIRDYPATERIDTYFDVGSTDPAKDLDVVDATVMRALYKDPSFLDGNFETSGVLAPKALIMRCLLGSGLIYLNANPDLSAPNAIYQAPIPLHAGAGMLYLGFPKSIPHFSKAVVPGSIPPVAFTTSISLLTLYLRTFEAANRFQMVIFK